MPLPDAFAACTDAYAAQHPDRLSAESEVMFPVSGADAIALWERGMFLRRRRGLGGDQVWAEMAVWAEMQVWAEMAV
jgi:hypothetical protein